MAVTYQHYIHHIDEEDDLLNDYKQISELPDTCPVCQHGISPEYFMLYFKKDSKAYLQCGCPRENCASLFTVEYAQRIDNPYNQNHPYIIENYYPKSNKTISFPKEIENLSLDFIEIYQQASRAESEGLNLICGAGYRKALEHLVKDYAISLKGEEDRKKIQSMPLQQCVQKYISEESIKDMAEMAIWLGNDETHYVKKWANKDIDDLKNLIDLTVYFLSMSLKAEKYKAEMLSSK